MKNRIILLMGFLLGIIACEQEDIEIYSAQDNIYFNFEDEADSTITYTFAYNPDMLADTIFLPISISGKRINSDRRFNIEVIPAETNAEPTLHYEPLADFYIMPADSGKTEIPLILYNKDPELQNKTVTIGLTVSKSDDFQVLFPTANEAKIIFSNRLERPLWWDLWESQLGVYSRVKHELYLIVVGNNDLLSSYEGDAYLEIPKNLYMIDKLRRFVLDPFAWVEENDQGYVLSERQDGNYDFYNENNPSKTFLLQLNEADGKYYFINENGQRVTIN